MSRKGFEDLPLFSALAGEPEAATPGAQAQPPAQAPTQEDPIKKAIERAKRATQARDAETLAAPPADETALTAEEPRAARSEDKPASGPKHLTVAELTQQIKGVLEPAFMQVWVKGEVSNYRPAASGHLYFSLKDQAACISVASFGWGSKKAKLEALGLRDGVQVLCRGKVSLYAPRGNYQLVVDHIEPVGAGALQYAFEQLKTKLSEEGLFEAARKRELPAYPTRIAVVTSPSGAAIRDMLHILQRRAPHIRVTVIPAVVQGDGAAEQIIKGLEIANRHKLGDIVVLARGGGSIEDLWCFNDERLARAIAASRLPVVSAVGHEIDYTISDFVSDFRAPTPSAAAEIVSGHWVASQSDLRDARSRLFAAAARDLSTRKTLLQHVSARLVSPRDRLREQTQRCDDLALRLERAWRARFDRRHGQLEQLAGKLDALSPLKVLERGYSIVFDPGKDAVVRSSKAVQPGQELRITFHDGQCSVRAT